MLCMDCESEIKIYYYFDGLIRRAAMRIALVNKEDSQFHNEAITGRFKISKHRRI